MLAFATTSAYSQQLTPAQAAWLKAETRKADEDFVRAVAKIADVRNADVSRAMPQPGRIANLSAHLVSALEAQLGKPLGEEQKAGIRNADAERLQRIATASTNARKH